MIESILGRLLVVDDEIDTLTPLCDLLSEWGYEVVCVTSGKDALEVLKEQTFDLLLTDLVMSEMDGIELLQAAQKIDPYLNGIIITGKSTIQTAVEAMKAGAFDYILKPLDFKVLKLILPHAMGVQRLRKSEERYRTIVEDYQTELICRFLPDGTLTFVNEAYCRYFNKKFEELIGQSFMSVILDEDREFVQRQFTSLSMKDPFIAYKHRVIKPNGEIAWQKRTDRAIFSDQGQLIEYQSVGRDITERVRAEEVLRKSEARYRDLYDNAPDMYHTLDKNGIIVNCNETEAKMLGYRKEEIIGRPITDFFSKESKRLFEISFPRLHKKNKLLNLEREFVRKDMTIFPAVLNVFSEYDKKGEFIGTKTIARDITERKQAEEELKKAYIEVKATQEELIRLEKLAALGRFSLGIAHEIRNPLANISAAAQFCLAKYELDGEFKKHLRLILRNSKNANKIIEELLDLSKPVEFSFELDDVGKLINRICGQVKTRCYKQSVRLYKSCSNELPEILIAEKQLGRAFLNFILNALDAMPDGGSLTISACPVSLNNEVVVSFLDTGCGIPQENLDKVFEPFFTTKDDGVGLGLSLAHEVINFHKGKINIESKVGKGTNAVVRLPISRKE